MSKHPLWALAEPELEALLAHRKAPASFRNRVRVARQGPVPDVERQSLVARWGSVVGVDGFRWPWVALNSTLGLLPMGEMAVVLAQSGQGKSTFVGSLVNRLPTTPTLVFATETKDEKYRAQLAARRANLNPDAVVLGDWHLAHRGVTADEARKRFEDAEEQLHYAPLTVAPYLSLRASQMADSLKRAVDNAAHPPQVVIIDHFQAIEHDLATGFNGQQETLRLLHEFADREYVTVIVTNQAHLRGQGTPPRPTDCIELAGNFGGQSLIQYAAQVLGIHRVFQETTKDGIAITPDFLKKLRERKGNEKEFYDPTRAAIDLPKVRFDGNGTVGAEVRVQYRNGQFWDIEE